MNDFSRQDIEALKAGVDLVELMRSCGLDLKPSGKNFVVVCPWHDDSTASLTVNPEKQLYNCFGCEAGGDALSFLQSHEQLPFRAALERLKELSGAPGPVSSDSARTSTANPASPADHKSPGNSEEGLPPVGLLTRVAEVYQRGLSQSKEAQQYLEERGLGNPEMWKAFRLGFADGSLLNMIPAEGEIKEELESAGVLSKGKERFRGCIVAPITHPDHGVMGFYGRRINKMAKIRHLFRPGPLRGLFHWQALRTAGSGGSSSRAVVLTESVFDALSLWVAGVRDVTCTFGVSSLPIDLVEAFKRYQISRVVFFFDGDEAGRDGAAKRAKELAARHIACDWVELPSGDPNEILLKEGPENLKHYLKRAKTLAEPVGPSFSIEELPDGFIMNFGPVSYQLSFKSPGAGGLRVRVKATNQGLSFMNALDLESHRGRTSTVNQVSRRLKLAKEKVEAHFMRLVEEAERVSSELAEQQEQGQTLLDLRREIPEMMEEERLHALSFLKEPDLTCRLQADMEALGYVGEDRGKLLAYLIGLSRKLKRPLSGRVTSQSSAGKSGMTELVEMLTAPEDVVLFSRLSTHALGYLPQDFLKHKLLIIEERVGGEAADYSIRVLQSKHKLSQAVPVKDPVTGVIQTRLFEVEGPIAYLETTTSARVNYENATRCFEINLDETEEQTRRIHRLQRQSRTLERFRSHAACELIKRKHHNAQRLLEPVTVIIPFVHQLRFPSRWLRTRRDHERFLCLIEVVTFLHQHQRERGSFVDEAGELVSYVEATVEDYSVAYELAQEVLQSTLHELSKAARDLWDLILKRFSEEKEFTNFTRREMRTATGWPDRRLVQALSELVDMEYLTTDSGSQGRAYRYSILAGNDDSASLSLSELTTPDDLRKSLLGEKK